ncbi:hypothetical protein, partial [Ligilactobacillus ruminis]|uniref:hypothetical protein n=1 Tax=Ligilactobacillus ruminis TaxID=1623 RepID=UPI001F4055DC
HAASVRPEPGSNSQFIVCDSKFTSELTSQILLLLFKTRSPAHLLIETLFSFQRSVSQVTCCDFLSISSTNYLVNNFFKSYFRFDLIKSICRPNYYRTFQKECQ